MKGNQNDKNSREICQFMVLKLELKLTNFKMFSKYCTTNYALCWFRRRRNGDFIRFKGSQSKARMRVQFCQMKCKQKNGLIW